MFIELTDFLRCPENHPEQYLVLLPGRMEGRLVLTGELGCPVCGKVVQLQDGIVDFGGATVSSVANAPTAPTALTAEAIAAFLGLSGPGGFVALVGNVAALADQLAPLLPGIGLVLVNPTPNPWAQAAGILQAARLPIKQGSMRGSVIGSDLSGDPAWVAEAARAVLPGLRVIGEGGKRPDGIELLGESEGIWVGVSPRSANLGRSQKG